MSKRPVNQYSIGNLASEFDLPPETIRYYERESLLPEPERSASNYRLYGETHRERLAFIRNCRALDMTLGEIRELLAVNDDPKRSCEDANALVDSHIVHVAERIKELRQLQVQLQQLRKQCAEIKRATECAILNELSSPRRSGRRVKSARRTHLG